jgi:hypothetical protein
MGIDIKQLRQKKRRNGYTPALIRSIAEAIRLLPSKQLQEGNTEEDGTSGEYNTPQNRVASGVDRQFAVQVEKDETEHTEDDGIHTGNHVDDNAGLVIA